MSEHRPHREGHTDTHTNEELFHVALTNGDEDIAWSAVAELQCRGSRDVFEQAHQLCVSKEGRARRIGADILGQLGVQDGQAGRAFHEETMEILLRMLEQEEDPEVLHAIAVALGHRDDPRAIKPLIRFRNHPNALVRYGVVYGLLGHEEALAIQTLIELSTDPDVDVRDWATCGLGSMIEADTPAIRAALLARLTDEDSETRGEAMVGLALRRDQRMVEPLLNDLEAGRFGYLSLEAAARIADQRLYPALIRLQETRDRERNRWFYEELEEALSRCQPVEKE